jgi:hypothetical protein
MADVAGRLGALVAQVRGWEDRYRRLEEHRCAGDCTDEQVEAAMHGHPRWDDPPPGWGRAELLVWSRGYLWAEGTHLGNAAEVLWSIRRQLETLLAELGEAVDGE